MPRTVVEPTCGRGAFLVAARAAFPAARLVGLDVSAAHLAAARDALGDAATLTHADFFGVDWAAEMACAEAPVLVLGNPPWVTSATIGAIGAANLPPKSNAAGLRGLDAITGKANFDVSEWMITRLVDATRDTDATIAVLCKASVARRVLVDACKRRVPARASVLRVDARAHFRAAVDAALLVIERAGEPIRAWDEHDGLSTRAPARRAGIVDGAPCPDLGAAARTRDLEGESRDWRSGVKHDCAAVMELSRDGGRLVNGLGEPVDVEEELVYPLLKSSDVARGLGPRRWMVVTQRALADDTRALERRCPRAWAYLARHAARLAARKSSVYAGRPPYAMFGVGDYAFADHKVAVSGLYKRARFSAVAPFEGRPVLVDDTCYALPCADGGGAARLAEALNGPRAQAFFAARAFTDSKRPITKALLASLSIEALLSPCGG
ncbi:MAG TPA: hypothetical protein VGM56_00355 [Byssovorax sp.]